MVMVAVLVLLSVFIGDAGGGGDDGGGGNGSVGAVAWVRLWHKRRVLRMLALYSACLRK